MQNDLVDQSSPAVQHLEGQEAADLPGRLTSSELPVTNPKVRPKNGNVIGTKHLAARFLKVCQYN